MESAESLAWLDEPLVPDGHGGGESKHRRVLDKQPKPTPRILGRYGRAKRVPRPPSSVSDLNDADSEFEHAVVLRRPTRPITSQSRQALRNQHTPQHDDSEVEYEAAPAIGGFLNSKSPATQRIVLTTIFRGWLSIAVATRARRNELLRKWTEAMHYSNRSLLLKTLKTWRSAAETASLDAGGSYEKAQLKLANMYCRILYQRRAFARLMDSRDLQQKLDSWMEEAPKRLLVACWIKWRDQLVNKRKAALQLAADKVEQTRRLYSLGDALRCWRRQAVLSHCEHAIVQWRNGRILRESIHVWHLQCKEVHYVQHQKKSSPTKRSLVRWRDAAGMQHKVREAEIRNKRALRRCFLSWRATAQQAIEQERQADTRRQRSLLFVPLDRLSERLHAYQGADAQAKRFDRYQTLTRALETWRQHVHTCRDNHLQSRALRDLSRRRNDKHRHLVLAAWREVARRIARAEQFADELVSRRRRAKLVTCFRQWHASCTFANVAPHTGQIPRHAPGPPPAVLVHDAQTMTSMVEEPSRRERAISIQTESGPAPTTKDSEDRQELLRRVREAEEEASRYKTRYVDPKQAAMDFMAREEMLEERLAQWRSGHQRRMLRLAFRRIRSSYINSRRHQEQETHLLSAIALKHRDDRVRQILRQWQSVAQSCARSEEAAVSHSRRISDHASQVVCHNVLCDWRELLKEQRQLMLSADKRRQVRIARKFLSTLARRFSRQREWELEANSSYRMNLLSRAWAQFSQQFAQTRTSRLLTSVHISDRDALQLVANEGVAVANNALGGIGPSALDSTALIDLETLKTVFSAWHDLVGDVRDIQGAVLERLPAMLQQRAMRKIVNDEGFDWHLLHQKHLLVVALRQWRQRLSGTRAARIALRAPLGGSRVPGERGGATASAAARTVGEDDDGPNARELQRYEKIVAAGRLFRLKSDAWRRWIVATRGRLFGQKRLFKSMKQLMTIVAGRVRQVKAARETERLFQLRHAVGSWRMRYVINRCRMDNAHVQANATCVRLCLLHWLSQIRAHSAHKNGRALYMAAVAFRWERQARRALQQWMHASSNDRIKVKLAQRAGLQRETQLMRAAAKWSRNRILQTALGRLRASARRHALQHKMGLRLATAWGNANTQRHALATWRQRISPSSSMFFSVIASPE